MSNDELKHAKVVTPELQEDGSVKYTTDSYYEDLTHTQVEIEKQIPTSRNNLLKDVISCLDSNKDISIRVKFKHKEPVMIIKRWTVSKESFNRR